MDKYSARKTEQNIKNIISKALESQKIVKNNQAKIWGIEDQGNEPGILNYLFSEGIDKSRRSNSIAKKLNSAADSFVEVKGKRLKSRGTSSLLVSVCMAYLDINSS